MATSASRIDSLARLLIDARTAGESIDSLPPAFAPADVVEAQLVDDRVAELSGWPVLGWKIGCTSEHAQKLLGADGPFAGRIYSIHQSGVVLADDDLMVEPKLEGEIAFEIGHDLGPFDGACERSVVSDAVSAVMPAIEFVGGRFTTFIGAPLLHVIADAGSNSLLVVGDRSDPACIDGLDAAQARMEVDGEITGQGRGADVLGHPLTALVWLVDHLSGRGIGLSAGQIVTTGTATQVSKLPVGSTAVATVEGLGSVAVSHGRGH
ncbi:MAG: fumarylacetoacetate hydrolase family protein [Acidimicrobiales bacterium]|nr:fumarylacetoacetate hydrolase family protein [Acidimicrobiales bacterium]